MPKKEKWYFVMIQIVIPFLIAGMGMVCAGVLLDEVQVGYHLLEILINFYKTFTLLK